MYVVTVFGFEWRSAVSAKEVLIILIIILFAFLLFFLYKYGIVLQNRALQKRLDFHLKIKQFGLSGLQVKIINLIIKSQKLKDPLILFRSPDIYEASIGDVMISLMSGIKDGETLENICKNILITYENIYHHAKVRKPIEKISDIEENVLLYFYKDISTVYVGKLINKSDTEIQLQLFRNKRDIPEVEIETHNFFLWRTGDAEYSFKSKIISFNDGILSISPPEEFKRGKEVRLPYVDVNIPCRLILSDPSYHIKGEQPEPVHATILKVNEFEVVLKLQPAEGIDYRYMYSLEFEIDEFKENIMVTAIAEKSITDGDDHFYTCKFMEFSEAARTVLRKFIISRL